MLFYEWAGGQLLGDVVRAMVAMADAYGRPVETLFNENKIVVNPGDSPEDVTKACLAEMERQREEYRNSPEYVQRQAEANKQRLEREAALNEALTHAPDQMALRDEEYWKKIVEMRSSDDYADSISRFAERWARLMEVCVNKGETIEACAEKTFALTDIGGMSGCAHSHAVRLLSQVWVHGEQLRRWHNKDVGIGTDGDEANEKGHVINPAVFSIVL